MFYKIISSFDKQMLHLPVPYSSPDK